MKGQGWAERVKIDKRENNGKKTSVLKLFLSGTDCGCLSWKILTHKLRHGDKRDLEIQGRLRLQTQYLINFQGFDECHGNRCICILWDFIEFFIKQSLLSVTHYCWLKINLFRLKNYETVGVRYFITITSQNIDGYCFLFNRLNGLSSWAPLYHNVNFGAHRGIYMVWNMWRPRQSCILF